MDQLLVHIVLNFAINWLLVWTIHRGTAVIPLWGMEGLASDILAISLVLPLVNCVINTAVLKRHARQGRVPRVGVDMGQWPWRLASKSVVRRGLVLALLCLVFVALPTLGILNFFGPTHFALRMRLAVTASYAALLAALTSPVIAVTAAAQFWREGTAEDFAGRSAAV